MRVVPAFEPGEDGHPRLGLALEAATIDDFTFESSEEALGHGVVIGITFGSHGRHHPGFPAALAECVTGVLTALIRMMDDRFGSALRKGHIESIKHQFGSQVIGHCPTDNAPRPDIEHDGEIQEARRGREWSKKQGVVGLFPCFSSPNRTCASQRIRLSIQEWLNAMATSG